MKNRTSDWKPKAVIFLVAFLLGVPFANKSRLYAESDAAEEVVIGYGSRAKRDVTSSISTINADVASKSIAMSPEFSMQGTMSGVQVSGNTGNPIDRPTIRIRGTNSWGISDPLYVIDGIPVIELGSGAEALNSMALIDPDDIESISVLKDASSAAIYGMRAANGVILITTKKGRKGKPTVGFSGRFGIQNIYQELDFYNTPRYTAFVQEMYRTNPAKRPDVNNFGLFDPSHSHYLGYSPTYNWADAVRHKNAPVQDYSVRVSGGSDNTDYYVSMNYSNTEGSLQENYFRRYSGSVKINTTVNKWLRIGMNYRLAYSKGRDGIDDYFNYARAVPWQPIRQENKEMPGYKGYAYVIPGFYNNGREGVWDQTFLYGAGTVSNELGRLASSSNWDADLRNMGTAYVELTLVKGLSVKGSIGIDYSAIDRFAYTDYNSAPFIVTEWNPWVAAPPASMGGLEKGYNNSFNQIEEIMINYANSFNDHNIDFLVNFMDQHFVNNSEQRVTADVSSRKDYLMTLGSINGYTLSEKFQNRFALMGYMFRAGYNYARKYYIDATVRRDGSARFAPEKRWGTFPALSLAWRIKNESFMDNADWLDDLKLRSGWGRLGNQEVCDRAYLSPIANPGPLYAFGSKFDGLYPAAGYINNGATIYGIPNSDLVWERTETVNVGFDARFFKGLSASFEVYNKKTKGIIQTINIPASVGVVNMPLANIAGVRNSGVEINLNYSGRVGNFNYSVGGNFTTVKNKVLEMYDDIPITKTGNDNLVIEERHSMFYHKAYRVGGVFQTQKEVDEWKAKHKDLNHTAAADLAPGDFYFQDLRGAPKKEGEFYSEGPDGIIDSYDMVDVGNSLPGFFYGINFDFEYRGLDLSAQFTGVGDVVKYNAIKAQTFFASEGANVTDIVEQRWRPENPSSEYPRLVFGDPNANLRRSDFFYESAAYLRCSNLQLGYTLPLSEYKDVNGRIRNVRVYIGFSNLFTITKYSGLDPESDIYPMPRTFFMGLNARF